MLFANTYQPVCVVDAGPELRVRNGGVRHLRVDVELALASAQRVVVDLRGVCDCDSWALLALVGLAERYGRRVAFVAAPALRDALAHLGPDELVLVDDVRT